MDEFEKQDAFARDIVQAYDKGILPEPLKPYIEWKRGNGQLPTREEAYYIVSICEMLQNVSDELSTMLPILK